MPSAFIIVYITQRFKINFIFLEHLHLFEKKQSPFNETVGMKKQALADLLSQSSFFIFILILSKSPFNPPNEGDPIDFFLNPLSSPNHSLTCGPLLYYIMLVRSPIGSPATIGG
jgi:hypothetical protein